MSDEKIDIGRALKTAITTGKVEFGLSQTQKAVKEGKAQMSSSPGTALPRRSKETSESKSTSSTETTWSSELSVESLSLFLPL